MKLKYFLLLLASYFIITNSCNTTEPPIITPPPPDLRKITLTVEDASCTEVWLKIKADSLTLPAELTLKQYNPTGDSLSQIFVLNTQDSVLYIDSLLPDQTYNYQAVLSTDTTIKSEKVTAQTLEPTSHNFTWQTWEFGQHSSSVLYDVAIIDENNIWAVGEIYMNDSLGNPDPNVYNAAHWNGNNWELKRIPYYHNGQTYYSGIKAIYAFDENDIWFGIASLIHWNGTVYQSISTASFFPATASKIWGSSSNDLYIVGTNGQIAHYNGTSWTKIESGTTVDLLDVWGSPDGTVWTCGYNSSYSLTVLLKINNNIAFKLYEGSPNNQNNNLYIGPLSGGWTNSKYFTYLLNWGKLYRQDNKDTLDLKELSVPLFYDVAFAISANDKNDIYVSGESGMFGHFNGVRFYDLPDLRKSSIQYLGNNIKNDLFITVGWDYSSVLSKAIITIGSRN